MWRAGLARIRTHLETDRLKDTKRQDFDV
jgi:hypothetical protein